MTDTTATDPTLPADGGPPARAVEQLVIAIELGRIKPSPTNPRKIFDEVGLRDLAESIKSKGVLSPILVRPARKGDGFELVFGERRWRAANRIKTGLSDGLERLAKKAGTVPELVALTVESIAANNLEGWVDGLGYQRDEVVDLCKALGVDVKALEKAARARLKEREAAEAPAKATPAKKGKRRG